MSLQHQFNLVSEKYDNQRSRLIPCFADFYGIAIENLELESSQPEILDLGAGTGLFSQMVLNKYPNAHVELVDVSEKMLDIAKIRFSNPERVTLQLADYTRINYPSQFDAIVSSLSIHHLEDPQKIDIYQKIFSWLKPGGLFIHAEQVLAESPYFQTIYHQKWKEKVEATDLDKAEILSAYERVNLDRRTPLSTQLMWLTQAGFAHVDCLYKYYDFSVIYAKKQGM